MDPQCSIQVENYYDATSQLAQTSLRAILGQHDLDQILSERDKLNHEMQKTLDDQTDPWGVKVTAVEIKDVDLDETMVRAMAKQAEAERTRRAKVILAEGSRLRKRSNKLQMSSRHNHRLSSCATYKPSVRLLIISHPPYCFLSP